MSLPPLWNAGQVVEVVESGGVFSQSREEVAVAVVVTQGAFLLD
jgi:hypothetical protein